MAIFNRFLYVYQVGYCYCFTTRRLLFRSFSRQAANVQWALAALEEARVLNGGKMERTPVYFFEPYCRWMDRWV